MFIPDMGGLFLSFSEIEENNNLSENFFWRVPWISLNTYFILWISAFCFEIRWFTIRKFPEHHFSVLLEILFLRHRVNWKIKTWEFSGKFSQAMKAIEDHRAFFENFYFVFETQFRPDTSLKIQIILRGGKFPLQSMLFEGV